MADGAPLFEPGPPVSRRDLEWETRLERLEFDILNRVRSAAEKWATSLGAILALSGTIFVVKGRDDVTKLADEYQAAVFIALVIALVVAAGATYLAALAAQGTPARLENWPTGAELRDWELKRAAEAQTQLKASRWLASVAVLGALLAVGLTWFGEGKQAEAPTFLVVYASGDVECGTLAPSGGTFHLKPRKGPSAAPADVEQALVVDRCP
jgi:hypothetical protein